MATSNELEAHLATWHTFTGLLKWGLAFALTIVVFLWFLTIFGWGIWSAFALLLLLVPALV